MLILVDSGKVVGVVYALESFVPSTNRLVPPAFIRIISPDYRIENPQTSFLLYPTMVLGRQRDHIPSLAVRRRDIIRTALPITGRWRQPYFSSFPSISRKGVAQIYLKLSLEPYSYNFHRQCIHTAVFEFKFAQITDNACLKLFHFPKEDIAMMVLVIAWHRNSPNSQRNCFRTTPRLPQQFSFASCATQPLRAI